jgi:hypothetical protein
LPAEVQHGGIRCHLASIAGNRDAGRRNVFFEASDEPESADYLIEQNLLVG